MLNKTPLDEIIFKRLKKHTIYQQICLRFDENNEQQLNECDDEHNHHQRSDDKLLHAPC